MSKQKEIILACIQAITHSMLDGLFPRRCFGCGEYDTFLCDACLDRIPRRIPTTYFIAHSSSHSTSLDSLTSATFYRIPIVSLLIHYFKYQALQDLSSPLTKLLIGATEHTSIPLPDIITAVPLHSKRLRERGFNQSEHLAEGLTIHLNFLFPFTMHLPLLKKIRHTKPQNKQQNRETRLTNLIEAFAVNPEYKDTLKGKTIWLIDDVTTTGATLTECAKVLKIHGAKEVHGFVIAH